MFRLAMTSGFERSYRRFARQYPELRKKVEATFKALMSDPFAPSLRLHALQGALDGLQAVSVNYEYRIVLCIEIRDSEVILHDIGTYDEVYG